MASTVHSLQAKKARKKFPNINYKGYLHLPNLVVSHPDFIALSGKAIKLLVDVGCQYNGKNNGDLCCSRTIMRERGWSSNKGLDLATRELVERGWLVQTRQGGLGMGPSLYAITWQPIHECKGKHDLKPTTTAYRNLGPDR